MHCVRCGSFWTSIGSAKMLGRFPSRSGRSRLDVFAEPATYVFTLRGEMQGGQSKRAPRKGALEEKEQIAARC